MITWRCKIRLFLTTLFISFGGIIPAAGCPGGCGPCFHCAGLGGVIAVLAAVGAARTKPRGEREERKTALGIT